MVKDNKTENFRVLGILLIWAALVFPGLTFANTTIFEEDFNGENGGAVMNNYTGFANWIVSMGNVDLIGAGGFDPYPGNGLYMDLDGSSAKFGTIMTTRSPIFMGAGEYELSIDLGGNARGGSSDMLIVSILLGGTYSEVFTLPYSAPLTTVTRSFTVGSDSNTDLQFYHMGNDDKGMILDNVKISAVPEPHTLILMGIGLLGVLAYRKKR